MTWVAIVPLKQGGEQKLRLSGRLSAEERVSLMDGLSRHVLTQLGAAPEVARVILLSPHRLPNIDAEWRGDLGRGLNAELDDLRSALPNDDALVVHADLPLLRPSDISRLASLAKHAGVALAMDRHGAGTNAIGLVRGEAFHFSFGENSFSRHRAQAPHAAVIARRGLSHDIDTPDDLDLWRQLSKSRNGLRSRARDRDPADVGRQISTTLKARF